jgi:hypothetical protein
MARTADAILQEQLGQLVYNIAVLGARLEKAQELNKQLSDECARLHAENETLKNPAPAKEVE